MGFQPIFSPQAIRSIGLLAGFVVLINGCSSEPAGDVGPPAAQPASATAATVANATLPAVAEATHELFVLGSSASGITSQTTLDDLRQRYGSQYVTTGLVPGVEGDELPGAILFPSDTTRRAYLYFSDGRQLKNLMTVRIKDAPTKWRTSHGVTNGTNSTELRKLNGASFSFIGMNWDFGGWIDQWNDGQLGQRQFGDAQVLIRISPAFNYRGGFAYPLGDRRFDSEHPGLQQAPAIVTEIGLRVGASASHVREQSTQTTNTSTP